MYGNSLTYLALDMETGAILPLGTLDVNPDLQNLGAPDVALSGSYHGDRNSTPEIIACMGVGLLPLGDKAAGQGLQSGLRLCVQKSVNRNKEQVKFMLLLDTVVKILMFIFPFRHVKPFFNNLM